MLICGCLREVLCCHKEAGSNSERALTRLSKITRPTDLQKLCLVCKELHEITVRELYYDVSLEVGSEKDHLLGAFLTPKILA
jgi:hypothetical protein